MSGERNEKEKYKVKKSKKGSCNFGGERQRVKKRRSKERQVKMSEGENAN